MHTIDHKSYATEKFHGSLDLSKSEKINGTYKISQENFQFVENPWKVFPA